MSTGLKPSITKKAKAATHTSKVAPAQKGRMSHPAGRKGNRMGPQMSKASTTKVSHKATSRVSGNTRVFAD